MLVAPPDSGINEINLTIKTVGI